MRFQIVLAVFLLVMAVACAAPAAPIQSNVQPTVAPTASPATSAPASPTTQAAASNQPGAVACAATYKVPGNEFRSDDPAKLDAGNKPKLIEFFAFW